MTSDRKDPRADETRSRANSMQGAQHDAKAPPPSRPASAASKEAAPNHGRDALGLVLLLLSFLCGVGIVLAYVRPQPEAGGFAALAMALVGSFGVASMFLAAGLCWIGLRLFIRGVDGKLGRDLFGIALTTCTLAVLVGALAPEFGGGVGGLGAFISRKSVFLGAIFGIVLVLLPAWFLWLRPAALAAGEISRSPAPLTPRASDSSGVTQAEADALLPKSAPRTQPSASRAAPAAEPAAEPASPATPASTRRDSGLEGVRLAPSPVAAPSPYPPDVRREGRVPPGARPLEAGPTTPSAGAPRPAAATQPAAQPAAQPPRATPEPRHELPAEDPHHAAALRTGTALGAGAAAVVGAVAPELRGRVQPPVAAGPGGERDAGSGTGRADDRGQSSAGPAEASALTNAVADDAAADGASEPAAEDDSGAETFADAQERAALQSATPNVAPLERTPPPPSWEQSDLFEEPVDAYGTPLSLVESLRKSDDGAPAAPEVQRAESSEEEGGDERPWMSDEEIDADVDVARVRPMPAVAPERELAREPDREQDRESPGESAEEEALHSEEATPPAASRDELRAELREFLDERGEEHEAEDSPPAHEAVHEAAHEAAHEAETAPRARAKIVERSLFGDDEPAAASPVPSSPVAAAPVAAPPHASVDAATPVADVGAGEEPRSAEPSEGHETSSEVDAELTPARPKRKSKSRKSSKSTAADDAALESSPAESDEPQAPAESPAAAESKAEAAEAPVETRVEDPAESEPEVEIVPAKPRARSRVTVDEVVFKAGCLFVERQRVAVSMLQREFGLDFDSATAVLDQLQRVGLIGPYLGGQRRDILMSLDEWQDLVGVE